MPNTQSQFDTAYMQSQDPRIIAASNISDPMDRQTALQSLARQGFKINVLIFQYGWSPFWVFQMATAFGYTWLPGINDPSWNFGPSGVQIPSVKPVDAVDVVDPVNVNLATAFPQFVVPPPVVTPPPALTGPFVGAQWRPDYPNYFFATSNGEMLMSGMSDEQTIHENGHTYSPFHLVGLIGTTDLWKQIN